MRGAIPPRGAYLSTGTTLPWIPRVLFYQELQTFSVTLSIINVTRLGLL